MATKKKKAKSRKASTKRPVGVKAYLPTAEEQLQTGMPAADSVREVVEAQSPSGAKFQILKTTERDSYDPPARPKKAR
jgi:hypothetical protein